MLILTEKPSVAKSFASALGIARTGKYYSNGNTEITNCSGHLYELSDPEGYDERYKKWSLKDLPIAPKEFTYKAIEASKDQARLVNKLLKAHKNDKIVIATDADREGEVIARIVFAMAGLTNTSRCVRFWVSAALTDESVREGMKKMKPWDEYEKLAAKGFARQHGDWLVGMNLSRLVTLNCGNGEVFPIGRVQTAVLAAIAQRDKEINNFKPTPYYECEATLKDAKGNEIKALLVNPKTGKTTFNERDAFINDAASYASKDAVVSITAETARKTSNPPKLLNLTGLSKLAASELDMSAADTERTAEKLYDEYKCLSYPRTPSSVMGESEEDVKTYRAKFDIVNPLYPMAKYCDKSLINIKNKHLFNDAKLEGHHALIPFDKIPSSASAKEKGLYDIVVRSFLMACMPPCIYDEKKLTIKNGKFMYKATARIPVSLGWKAAQKKGSDDDEAMTPFDEKTAKLVGVKLLEKMTKPKKDFTETTLLAFMENPTSEDSEGKLVGLGTEATRGKIIQRLSDTYYVEKDGKKLHATKKGVFLLTQLFRSPVVKKIASISCTTAWEKQLDSSPSDFERDIRKYVNDCITTPWQVTLYERPGQQGKQGQQKRQALGKCPMCGANVYECPKSYSCENWKATPKCAFVLWKEVAHAKLTATDVTTLLSGGMTGEKKMKKNDGTPFVAKLRLNTETHKVEFVMDTKKTSEKAREKKPSKRV